MSTLLIGLASAGRTTAAARIGARTPTSPAHPMEGRGEFPIGATSTLDLLRLRYRCNYITAEQLLHDHLPHISSERHLLDVIRAGRLSLQLHRLDESRESPRIVYLRHLAEFLDQCELIATETTKEPA